MRRSKNKSLLHKIKETVRINSEISWEKYNRWRKWIACETKMTRLHWKTVRENLRKKSQEINLHREIRFLVRNESSRNGREA